MAENVTVRIDDVFVVRRTDRETVKTGIPGLQGPPGPIGNAFLQDAEPTGNIAEGSLWFAPTSRRLRVYYANAWRELALDGEYF